jgi:hypothetical protein
MLNRDQAITALRSRPAARAHSGYQILREFQPEVDGARLAGLALEKARTAHEDLFLNGALVGLLRDGGYLVVEYDPATDRALDLHLITRGEDGHEIIETSEIRDQMTVRDVKGVTERTHIFMTMLLKSQSSDLTAMMNEFFGDVPTFAESDEKGFFGVPRKIVAFGSAQSIRNLSALSAGLQLWPFRFAMSLPEYSANPRAALDLGFQQRSKLAEAFLATKGQPAGYFYDLQALGTINGPEQLKERVRWLSELDAYLDAHTGQDQSRWVFAVNVSIATIPVDIVSYTRHGMLRFGAATASILLPYWSRRPGGELRLIELSAVGD